MNALNNTIGHDNILISLLKAWFFLLLGSIALIDLGLAAIGSAFIATLASVVAFGIQLLAGGFFVVVMAAKPAPTVLVIPA